MANHSTRDLTLFDRLSRLTYPQAARILGPRGKELIRSAGGGEIDIGEDVALRADEFRLRLGGSTVTITLAPDALGRLGWSCDRCDDACQHVGAAFSLILEEKMALGLSAPPAERVPIESLSEEEFVTRGLEERAERARAERMRLTTADPDALWTDYAVTNAASGRSYRVTMRGWEPGQSYCSCPDFRKNTLGT